MGTRPHKSRAAPNMRVFYDFLVKSSSRYQSGKQKWCPRLSFLKFWSQVQPELLLQSGGHFADLVWCKSSSGYRPVHIFVGIEPWTAEQRPSFGDPGSRVTRKKQGFHTRECFSPMNSHVPDLLYSPLLLPHMNCPCSLRGWHHDHIMAWWWHDGDQLMTRWEVVHNSEAFKLYKFLLIIYIYIYIDIYIYIYIYRYRYTYRFTERGSGERANIKHNQFLQCCLHNALLFWHPTHFTKPKPKKNKSMEVHDWLRHRVSFFLFSRCFHQFHFRPFTEIKFLPRDFVVSISTCRHAGTNCPKKISS